MKKFRLSMLLGTVCMVLILAACAPTTKTPGATTPKPPSDKELTKLLAGPVWVAEYIHGRPVIDMSHTSMVFTTAGKVSGLGGCNAYTGSYKLKNGKISFSPLAATMKMCVPGLDNQESRFFESLNEPHTVRFVNGILYLVPAEGEPSTFGPQQ